MYLILLSVPLPPTLILCGLPTNDSQGSGLGKHIICMLKYQPVHCLWVCNWYILKRFIILLKGQQKQAMYYFSVQMQCLKNSALIGNSQVPLNTNLNYWCISVFKSSLSIPQGLAGGFFTFLWGFWQKYCPYEAVPKGTMLACHGDCCDTLKNRVVEL